MRILWLSHLIPYPPKGGALQRAYHLTKEICQDHDVDLISFNQKDLIKNFNDGNTDKTVEEARHQLSKYFRSVDFLDIPADSHKFGKHLVALSSLVKSTPYTINWLRSRSMEKLIQSKLEQNSYDLIHIDTISLDIYRPLFKGTPVILDHHNIESHMMIRRSKKEPNWVKKLYYFQEGIRLRNYEKRVLSSYSGHITCSEIDARRLKNLEPRSLVKEIPNGVDTEYFCSPGAEQDSYTLVFAGRMNWYPNIEAAEFLVNRIFPLLKNRYSSAKLIIAGANPPKNLIEKANNQADIEVTGFVDDIRPYIDRATVYVCPIMDGGGTKLKILDALAMAKPIVANNIAAEGIHVENGRNIILADTPEEYVDAISSLFDSQERRSKLAEEARRLAINTYDFQKIGKKLSSFYRQVADKS